MSCSFDQLLDGGLYTAEITEVIGPVASGKTQVDTLQYYRESSCCSVVIRLRSITSYYIPSVCICMCVCMYVYLFVCMYICLYVCYATPRVFASRVPNFQGFFHATMARLSQFN